MDREAEELVVEAEGGEVDASAVQNVDRAAVEVECETPEATVGRSPLDAMLYCSSPAHCWAWAAGPLGNNDWGMTPVCVAAGVVRMFGGLAPAGHHLRGVRGAVPRVGGSAPAGHHLAGTLSTA